jgi:hypothetical protein
LQGLLGDAYGRERFALIYAERASHDLPPGDPVLVVGDGVMLAGYQAIAVDGETGVYADPTEMCKDGAVMAY